ncbi:hypothetical protein IGJ41_002730 [Enterococcus sp. DIV1537a]|uniref:hypothetical protein n=1 Tax=Enterococcus sp. DIV1537a TaxID=2774733 RepID=UPI003F286D36
MLKDKDTKKKFLIIFILIIVLFFLWKKFFTDENIEQGSVNYNTEYENNISSNIIFPAYEKNIQMDASQQRIPIELVNPKSNSKVFFKYKISITVEDNEKLIYESKLIKSGQAVVKPEFDKSSLKGLHKGVYECKINIDAYTYSVNEYSNKKILNKLNNAYWNVKFNLL